MEGYLGWLNFARNCLLRPTIEGNIKGGIEVRGDEEEDVGSYWMTLRKGEDTHIYVNKL
jgi:hypothetical protein